MSITKVSFSVDEKQFLTSSIDNSINIWKTEDYSLIRTVYTDAVAVNAAVFS